MSDHYLYDDTVLLQFNDAKHLYTVDGMPVASVTGILKVINKPALMFWAGNCVATHWHNAIEPGETYDEIQLERIMKDSKMSFRQKSGDAASIGTIVHDYAEQVALGNKPKMPVNKQAKDGVKAFLDWVKDSKVEFIEPEFKVFSKDFVYVGTCDLDCMIDGKRTILDYKTSSGIYPEMHFQTAAYAYAREEELIGAKDNPSELTGYDQRAIVLFNKKNGKFKVEYRDMGAEFENDFSAFKGALMLHKALGSFKGKK